MRDGSFPSMLVMAGTLCCGPLACNQSDPMGSTTSDSDQDPSDESGPPPPDGDYYPLVDGATWTYRHTDVGGVVWDEIVQMRELDYQGTAAFEIEDNEDTDDESTLAVLVRDGTMTLRVHKDVSLGGVPTGSADYDPGFLRFDEAWQEGDVSMWSYERTEYDAAGVLVGQAPRDMVFTIESSSTEVTVPAGTFDCVQLLRARIDNGDLKRYWFARGVGKVKHESLVTGATEELAEYAIP
ncbi:hypothetical protein [Paraliomyxa miuraensis]|uniref:hypothetical protein n=1 Tax=Paraliomyxa miuraensis TaxID=376150 RepID=UPI00224F08CD|nr:hypothetical protein [Paraliomyxa miuraensis]MCX4240331.1 hypothetical protein [Paraliomyxa miuraensis]